MENGLVLERIFRSKSGENLTLLAERHHSRLPVAECVKRFVSFAAGASPSKALTASAKSKHALCHGQSQSHRTIARTLE